MAHRILVEGQLTCICKKTALWGVPS
jgi:hypothetical protein